MRKTTGVSIQVINKCSFFYASFLLPWNPSGCNPNMFCSPQEAPLHPLTDAAAVASWWIPVGCYYQATLTSWLVDSKTKTKQKKQKTNKQPQQTFPRFCARLQPHEAHRSTKKLPQSELIPQIFFFSNFSSSNSWAAAKSLRTSAHRKWCWKKSRPDSSGGSSL